MFAEIENALQDSSTAIKKTLGNYIVMGQVCIASAYRSQGIFRKLYKHMKSEVIPPFLCIITEVDSKNLRSLNAHYGIGFHKMRTYHSNGQDWELIYLQ
jgi:predicted GNAT superfamily acetyltransferase